MKKPDLQTEGVISFYDGVWILKYQNEFKERAEQKETTPERSMSFLDLKRSIPIAGNRRVPTYKRLLQEKQTIIAATSVGNAKITVYQSGYVIYEDGTRRTVMEKQKDLYDPLKMAPILHRLMLYATKYNCSILVAESKPRICYEDTYFALTVKSVMQIQKSQQGCFVLTQTRDELKQKCKAVKFKLDAQKTLCWV